jgi:hypothetical protein
LLAVLAMPFAMAAFVICEETLGFTRDYQSFRILAVTP